jgi:predicted MFS family arabinose efflux permease
VAALDHAREGARRYATLLRLPGARRPVIASAVGSMPIGMFGLAILLLAEDATGSFAVAGRVVGAFGIGNALGAVAQGRLMDRVGQTRVLRPAAVVHAVACAVLVIAALEGAGTGVLYACAAAGGLALPQLPAAMRSLWSTLARDQAQRETAYAMVSIVFEVSVITAPALAAAIVALFSPAAAVATGAAVASGGALAFSATGASLRWRGAPHDAGWLGPLAAPGMRTVFATLGAFGTAVGVIQVLLPAFADERGSAETGGLYLALLSAGSLAGGLIYGARSWPGEPVWRLPVLMLALGAGFALLAVATVPVVLGLLLLASGLVLAPATVVASTLLDTAAPPGTVTEAFAVMVMGIVAGTALGNALGGAIVEGWSYEAGALCAGAIAALGAAVALVRRRTLTPLARA